MFYILLNVHSYKFGIRVIKTFLLLQSVVLEIAKPYPASSVEARHLY